MFKELSVVLIIVFLIFPQIQGHGTIKEWSNNSTLSNDIGLNNPPENVSISGPSFGRIGELTEYSFYSDDPEGDNVSYYIKWEGSCPTVYGPYESSTSASISYVWASNGFYTISFKAVDEFGAESKIFYFDVVMPRMSALYFFYIMHILFFES